MTRLRLLTAFLGFIGLAAGGTWLFRQLPSHSPAGAASEQPLGRGMASVAAEADPEVAQLQLQINRLRQQLEVQQQTLARMQHGGLFGNPVADPAAARRSSDRTEQDRRLAYQRTQDARLSKLETELAEQVEDAGWSRAAEGRIATAAGQIAEALARDGVGQAPQLTGVTCRSSLCRLELGRGDELSTQRFVEQFPQRLGWRETHGLVQTLVNRSGGVDTSIYLSREGRNLYEAGEFVR